MLTYAFQELRKNTYDKIAVEDFEEAHDLFAEILVKGLSAQLKQGLHRSYVVCRDSLTTLRGKPDMAATIKNYAKGRQELTCEFDMFSEDCLFNRILKTTISLLIHHPAVGPQRKAALRKLMPFFINVGETDIKSIYWNSLRFDCNTMRYRMLIYICYFVIDNIIMTDEQGDYGVYKFSDDKMCRLFEKFVLEYYKRHHPELHPRARRIAWNIIEKESSVSSMPVMQTDIFMTTGERTLIIDTKYYGKTMQSHHDKATIHSNNLYQIFSYVMNHDSAHTGNTDGMLLYARTGEEIQPDGQIKYPDENTICYRNLDLSLDFNGIRQQLENLIKPYIQSI